LSRPEAIQISLTHLAALSGEMLKELPYLLKKDS